jgi:O-acetyl-ADP-ribose deacetylase (regulator of RNase III)
MSRFEHAYKGTRIEILVGDITRLDVDAIVNPANSSMIMGGGVAGAIKRAGGADIEEEAVRKAPVRVGEAIATKAGRLPTKFVIHAPTMTRPAMRINEENVQKAMKGALKCAHNLKISSLAFPALGTGVGGLATITAANIMMQELKKHLDESSMWNRVIFVGFREEVAEEFEKSFLKVFCSVGFL